MIQIRKVKVLNDRARKEADNQNLKDNDLVIIRTVINSYSLPTYKIEKIEGSPIAYLQKSFLNIE